MKLDDLKLGRFVLVKTVDGPRIGIVSVVYGSRVDITLLGKYTYIEADPTPDYVSIHEEELGEVIKIYPDYYNYEDCLEH